MDAYRLLGLQPGASLDDVRLAYHRLAVQHHPDQRPASERQDAELRMTLINQARAQVLRDIDKQRARRAVQVYVPQQRTREQGDRVHHTNAYVDTQHLVVEEPAPAPTESRGWRDTIVPLVLAAAVALGFAAGFPIPALLTLLGLLVVASVLAFF